MTETKHVIDPDSDAGVISAIDRLLAKDDIGIIATVDGWHVVRFTSFTHSVWETLETHAMRGDAYQAALCLSNPS
jgi:hypothetical protein